MERGPIVGEYHELRDYLNRANKLSNQKSEINFKIEQSGLFEYCLYAVLQCEHETHRLVLAERSRNKTWERAGYSRFRNLEEFCAKVFNEYREQGLSHASIHLSVHTTNKMTLELEHKLKNLLLNRSYEP